MTLLLSIATGESLLCPASPEPTDWRKYTGQDAGEPEREALRGTPRVRWQTEATFSDAPASVIQISLCHPRATVAVLPVGPCPPISFRALSLSSVNNPEVCNI